MAGEVDSEMKVVGEPSVNIDVYRELVKTYIDLHLYSAALFWSDKVVSLSNGDPKDVFWMAQCMFHTKQYHRAAHVICSRGLEKTHMDCQYIAVRSLLEARELGTALQILGENELGSRDASASGGVPPGAGASTVQLRGALLLLKGRVLEGLENRGIAVDYYRQALRADVHCYEAFEALVQHQMLSAQEETELLDSLPVGEQCSAMGGQLLRFLYQSKLKKYHAPGELPCLPQSPLAPLRDNLDVQVCRAERHYYNCNYQRCLQITEEVLKKDPYHSECLPVHIGCLVELKKSIKLFYLAHKLVDHYPEMAVSWFAVGCYYYVIGKSDPARRYLAKATAVDKLFGPAWLAYGHSFAAENEHDQAMAAYFKASQLMKGCHLPLLYIGLEYGLTNNVKLADKFFQQALSIAPHDPFVIHEMGVIAFQNQNYELAEKHFLAALGVVEGVKEPVLAEKWEALLNNLGHACRKLRKYPQALEYHRQALVLSPLNPSTYSAMGYVHSLQGDTSQAVDLFHKALGIRRDDTFSTTMLGYVVEQLVDSSPAFPGAPEKLPMIVELDLSSDQPRAVTPDVQPVPATVSTASADTDSSSQSVLMSLDADPSDSAVS
ncbi:cell division cycle protein 16 homolog [Bacillus rossius redtenbacheri]|uniref:cell division cycle protein 16 homolog n=1 Tax=Bacillus rossius redtenbacheri TaxID=93214 RepID=UPI002FDCFC34